MRALWSGAEDPQLRCVEDTSAASDGSSSSPQAYHFGYSLDPGGASLTVSTATGPPAGAAEEGLVLGDKGGVEERTAHGAGAGSPSGSSGCLELVEVQVSPRIRREVEEVASVLGGDGMCVAVGESLCGGRRQAAEREALLPVAGGDWHVPQEGLDSEEAVACAKMWGDDCFVAGPAGQLVLLSVRGGEEWERKRDTAESGEQDTGFGYWKIFT
jgi:hypothetical protein